MDHFWGSETLFPWGRNPFFQLVWIVYRLVLAALVLTLGVVAVAVVYGILWLVILVLWLS